jgi:peptidyl-prolyl cis-trans isomerase-like 4
VIQTGDPTNTGKGGESIYGICFGEQARYFEDEFTPKLRHNCKGRVSMANAGQPNTNGSQFFITLSDQLDYLDDKYTIFGEVEDGWETIEAIEFVLVDEQKKPFQVIRIYHTIILDDPFPDPPGMPPIPASPELENRKQSKNTFEVRLEDDDEEPWQEEQLDSEEREKLRRRKEARSRAEVLEIIGDIPDAEIKPPDNTLFVCKLNPVTRAEDLELIFSRFGECKAEIIKDKVTGESLCYGFIEFPDRKCCEQAFFKMNNCLIDDRRIRVDFSQSVAKLWNRVRRGYHDRFDEKESVQSRGKRSYNEYVFDDLERKALSQEKRSPKHKKKVK